jgi:hypothetical protein
MMTEIIQKIVVIGISFGGFYLAWTISEEIKKNSPSSSHWMIKIIIPVFMIFVPVTLILWLKDWLFN